MIKNSRQASVSKRTREELLHAAEQVPPERRSSFLELAEEIGHDLAEYEAIQAGQLNLFSVTGIDELGECLIKARLARGWTQRQLAQELQVSEQMVQRDEARLYEHAGLARMAEVSEVLGYNLVGTLQPAYLPAQMWRSYSASITVNMSVEFTSTVTWGDPSFQSPINLTSGPLAGLQPVSYGQDFGLPPLGLVGNMAGILATSNVVNPDFGIGTVDSAATVPVRLVGGKP